jgi:hypothetical protein
MRLRVISNRKLASWPPPPPPPNTHTHTLTRRTHSVHTSFATTSLAPSSHKHEPVQSIGPPSHAASIPGRPNYFSAALKPRASVRPRRTAGVPHGPSITAAPCSAHVPSAHEYPVGTPPSAHGSTPWWLRTPWPRASLVCSVQPCHRMPYGACRSVIIGRMPQPMPAHRRRRSRTAGWCGMRPSARRPVRPRHCHICTGTGLTPATSARGMGSPSPRLQRDWAHQRQPPAGLGPH